MRPTSIETIRTKIALPESTCVICFFAANTSKHAAHSSAEPRAISKTDSGPLVYTCHSILQFSNVSRRALHSQDYDYDYDYDLFDKAISPQSCLMLRPDFPTSRVFFGEAWVTGV